MPETLKPAEEIAALRSTNADLLKKARDRKDKVTEHEATIATLTTQLQTAKSALYDAQVGGPLGALADSVSPVPAVFLAELAKHARVELKDGRLVLLTPDGKPVMDGEKEVPFDSAAISKFLTAGTNKDFATFPHIMFGSKASGSGASPSPGSQVQYPEKQTGNQPERPQFGLR
jgi:hypothetical protein